MRMHGYGSMVVIGALTGLLAGCPGTDETPDAGQTPDAGETPDAGPGDEPGLAGDEFEEAAMDVFCNASLRCAAENMAPAFPDLETCKTFLESTGFGASSTFDQPAAIEASIVAGAITWDPIQGEACLAAIGALPCDGLFGEENPLETIASCQAAMTGTVASGGGCITHLACTDGLFCSRATEEAVCEGTCQAPGAGRCEMDEHCAAGERCVFDWESGNRCATPVADGGECHFFGGECAVGSACSYEGDVSVCRPIPAVGQPCSGECVEGARCVSDRESGTSVCVALAGDEEPCTQGECAAGFYCDFNRGEAGICAARGTAGEACSGASCADGLVCVGAENPTCRAVAAEGEACVDHSHCGDSGFFHCDAATEKCARLPAVGAPCVVMLRMGFEEYLCDPFTAWCDADAATPTCKAIRAHGAPCDNDQACGMNLGGGCVSGKCHRPGPEVCEP